LRTFDIGGDKFVSVFQVPAEMNPALGLRAVRLGLARPEIFMTQLRAMVRATAHGKLRILLPMIASLGELFAVKELFDQAVKDVDARGQARAEQIALGIMVEVPSAAVLAHEFAEHAAFMSIGTNDLVQYTLAIDRADESVAHLYNPLHPAVLRLVQFAVEAAARRGIPISICGEIAGDPRYAALLLGLGLRELSMAPRNIPRVKQRIRNLDMVAASRRARAIMDQSDSGRIAALLDDFNAMAEAR
jgi:phosphotransferase system enzyme I (PtsI)